MKEIVLIVGFVSSAIFFFCAGVASAQSGFLPPPPVIASKDLDASQLEVVIAQNKQILKLLVGIRDRIFMIESEQRERKIKEVEIQ